MSSGGISQVANQLLIHISSFLFFLDPPPLHSFPSYSSYPSFSPTYRKARSAISSLALARSGLSSIIVYAGTLSSLDLGRWTATIALSVYLSLLPFPTPYLSCVPMLTHRYFCVPMFELFSYSKMIHSTNKEPILIDNIRVVVVPFCKYNT